MRQIAWHHLRHTYLVDVGTLIDVPLMQVSKQYGTCILDPPYPKIRYFEIEIDELREGNNKSVSFQNIFPVRVKRKPGWHFLKCRIWSDSWTVAERIHFLTENIEVQWLYTDDFNMLFLSSGGRHNLGMLINLITCRINTIAQSFDAGNPIPSEFENQIQCRTAFSTLFREGIDGAFRDAAVYQDFGLIECDNLRKGPASLSGAGSCRCQGMAGISTGNFADLHIDINEIADLRDLSWLDY
jgi:hypothetical protein